MNRFIAHFVMAVAVLIGGGSLLLFAVFLTIGPIHLIRIDLSVNRILLWDALLSFIFFIQHSAMVRSGFRGRIALLIPPHFYRSFYAIASGIALTTTVLLWIPSPTILYRLEGPFRLMLRALTLLSVAGFWWGVRSLKHFDTFGVSAVKTYLKGREPWPSRFALAGPYLWVRHPLYFFTLVIIWSAPEGSLDRLLFNVLWTLWILLGSYLEEKDLVAEFGDSYRQYQRRLPMLIPWRLPDRKTAKSH